MKGTGVYAIRCIIDGKVYVGSAAGSFRRRWAQHQRRLHKGNHENRYLRAAWNKYGESSFEFLILEECAPCDCIAREQFWIDEKRAANRSFGFNLAPRAGSTLGFKLSDEAKARVSACLRGKKLSAETRARMSAAHQNPSPEYRAKMSAAKRGEIRSPETRAKMSIASRARKASEETRARIGAARRGRKHSEESKAKMSAASKGKKKSEATRAKMSEAVNRRWAAKRAAQHAVSSPLLPFMLEDSR